jgi:anhydro-N-acetylmuramic acid kinase
MIKTDRYEMIGLMSGTSGDGLDIAYCSFTKNENWDFQIKCAETVPFPSELEHDLKNCHNYSALELALLDTSFGKWIGERVKSFCVKNNIQPMGISSHGHTVFHQPQAGLSLQIGNGWALSQASKLPVINDFRMRDVQLGGQGAPLVPIGDLLLFGEMDYCLNLGGIANISFTNNDERIAFDICPFNLLLNKFALQKGFKFDQDGNLAKSGITNESLLHLLNDLPYYKIKTAKSLGREDLDAYFEHVANFPELSPEDVLATLIKHYCHQIHQVLLHKTKVQKILLTGGGAYNLFFVESLKKELGSNFEIIADNSLLIDFKEALIFAFLGVLRIRQEVNALKSVTGASEDSCGGTLYGWT